ncbi:glycoside hydrolase family 55 protein [Aspergillus lucknowensis]|uniref:Pectate lyase superfamily protein-domain-containing protein n=1 Tax=Aspergillus lucknowensis TaxID=176173 RepID=A0ABR4LYE2_9EURO
MVRLQPLALALFALGASAAVLEIPSVDIAVDRALKDYGNAAYKAPGKTTPHGKSVKPVSQSHADAAANGTFWLDSMKHQGISPTAPEGYKVYRNVKDFGATGIGDGVTDDTAAIQEAIASGDRCGQECISDTTMPALVYFPPGTYVISAPIFDYYITHIVGDANDLPVLKGSANFNGGYLIDADPYFTSDLNWVSTTVFFRTIRNFVFDLRDVPAGNTVSGIHWPTAQATSLQNIVFELSDAEGTQHQGIFCESGSAGFLGDLVFNGGNVAAGLGNQQFTVRNLTFNNAKTAISHYWDWGWTYKSISINDCEVGIDISAGGHDEQAVSSITLIDSSITNTPVGILTARDSSSKPVTAGSVIIENVEIQNVPAVVKGNSSTILEGTDGTIEAWGQGHRYTPDGPESFADTITANKRPESLVQGDRYYERSKPQYTSESASSFSSVRDGGAKGDASTDDTEALQSVIDDAASSGKIVFFDAGIYVVTKTLQIPAGSRIVGEALPVILSSGDFFNDMENPKPVVQVGESGQTGQVEWSDMIVSTRGAQAGAILIEWNLSSPSDEPSGMWEVHTRVGGFAGSEQQQEQCLVSPDTTIPPGTPNPDCIVAYMLMHITKEANGLYIENSWFWVADHDIDGDSQITLYSGRGLLIESTEGNIWLSGTAVEHNVLYQYQLVNTKNIYMGQIQTESAYYQPNPIATEPFPVVADLNDPDFEKSCSGKDGNCAVGWGLRVVDSSDILVYGAGLYSFFINNDASCSAQDSGTVCQNSVFSIEGDSSISVYNLNTVGVDSMADIDGESMANYADNGNVFNENIALFRNA